MIENQDYKVMPRTELTDGIILLRAVRPGDIELIRQWRNAQMDILRQAKPISPENQKRYFEEQVWPDKESLEPRQILLAIELEGKLIGYGGLVNICWGDLRAEVSFLLDHKIENDLEKRSEIFERFLQLIKLLSFSDLCLHRLWTETYAHRKEHVRSLERSGFLLEGCLRQHVIISRKSTDSLLHGILTDEWVNER
jgi:RimJ/RimL family protein N-acetyltransferase